MRKRPLFLLEIVIAIALVGSFSAYFLRSSIQYIYQERKALQELEFSRLCDLERMNLIGGAWNKVKTLDKKNAEEKTFSVPSIAGKPYSKTKKFSIWCAKHHDNCYDLVLQESSGKKDKEKSKKYHFFVKKEPAASLPEKSVANTEVQPQQALRASH